MRNLTGTSLWLGHVGDARDPSRVHSAGLLALVDLAAEEPPLAAPRGLVYHRLPLLDGAGNPPWLIRAAVDCAAGLLRANVPTLLYCSAGMSRSPVVAAAAVARVRGGSLVEVLAAIAAVGPLDASPALVAEVQAALA